VESRESLCGVHLDSGLMIQKYIDFVVFKVDSTWTERSPSGLSVKEIPLFDGLRKVQKSLCKKQGIPTVNLMTPKGNTFSFNDPRTLIANVSICNKIHDPRAHL
jgi:hypothetical protein